MQVMQISGAEEVCRGNIKSHLLDMLSLRNLVGIKVVMWRQSGGVQGKVLDCLDLSGDY